MWGRMLPPVYRIFWHEPYSSQQQWSGCLMNANNSIKETELQMKGEKKIANFPLKSVPNFLAYGGWKIKIHYIKSKSYRLLFLEHFKLETFVAEQFVSFLSLCTLPSIQQYHLWLCSIPSLLYFRSLSAFGSLPACVMATSMRCRLQSIIQSLKSLQSSGPTQTWKVTLGSLSRYT